VPQTHRADLLSLRAVERVIEEKEFSDEFFSELKERIAAFFESKRGVPAEALVEARYGRFRKF